MTDFWKIFNSDFRELLGEEDGLDFWQVAVGRILADTDIAADTYSGKEAILIEIGRCSHWILPHRKSLTGTACWPFGYGNVGQGYSYKSLPEFDWALQWVRQPESRIWKRTKRQPGRRPLIHRIAIPARTAIHPQATVHSIWLPGSPLDPRHKVPSVYGFAKRESGWQSVDDWQLRRAIKQ